MDKLNQKKHNHQSRKDIVETIASAIEKIRHSDVHIVIQDSKVIQINKTEKIRLEK